MRGAKAPLFHVGPFAVLALRAKAQDAALGARPSGMARFTLCSGGETGVFECRELRSYRAMNEARVSIRCVQGLKPWHYAFVRGAKAPLFHVGPFALLALRAKPQPMRLWALD